MISAGTVLAGRYRVVRHLGSGGMASVHLAVDESLGREVAVKRLHATPESELGQRIRREARLGARVRDPGIVTVFDVTADGEALLLVMEYVEGETLADLVARGPCPPDRALEILRPLAAALDHLHEEGVVHRDVKPANILLGANGAVKLTDLGVATATDATQITRTGGLVGTAAYMAPEQFEPGPATPGVDVYALAAVTFEILAGRRPYAGSTPFDVLGRVRDGAAAPDVRDVRPELPEATSAVLQRGMALVADERTRTAGAFFEELAMALRAAEPAAAAAEPTRTQPPAAPAPDPTPIPAPDPTPTPASAPAPTRAPVPAPAPRPRRDRSRASVVAALLFGLAAVVAIVALAAGGGGAGDDDPASGRTTARTTATQPATAAPPADEPATADASTPEGVVRALYERAADGQVEEAWELAGPGFRSAFGGSLASFRGTIGTLRAIEFRRLEQTGRSGDRATVAISTVARHTNRTDRCTGTVRTVRDGDGWLVDAPGISCS